MPTTFGEEMLRLIKKRRLSATAVARELGFKSRTAFFRILHDECRLPAIEKCFEAAKASAFLALDEEEIERLRESVSVSRLGKKNYRIHREIDRMLCPSEHTQENAQIEIVGMEQVKTIEDFMAILPEGGVMRILMAGQCKKQIIDRIHRLTQERNIAQITHLFAMDEEDPEDVKILSSISDILFSSNYSAYYLNETGKAKKNWWLRSGIFIFFHEAEDGTQKTIQLTWIAENRYYCLKGERNAGSLFWNELIENNIHALTPLKTGSGEGSVHEIQQYIDLTKQYQQIERNREIYTIRPDFPMNCIPVEIIAPPVLEAFEQVCPDESEQFEKQVSRLYNIHKERVENIYRKKKATHIILNEEAMRRFARTGSRSDHFFSTRPYSPQERVQVLTLLRDHSMAASSFHIWISKSPDILSDREVSIYDGIGVAIVKGDTSWRLDQDHQEVLLESPLLVSHFKSYFADSLLKDMVMTKEESMALLDEMIEIAREA